MLYLLVLMIKCYLRERTHGAVKSRGLSAFYLHREEKAAKGFKVSLGAALT